MSSKALGILVRVIRRCQSFVAIVDGYRYWLLKHYRTRYLAIVVGYWNSLEMLLLVIVTDYWEVLDANALLNIGNGYGNLADIC